MGQGVQMKKSLKDALERRRGQNLENLGNCRGFFMIA
jgi:hypothetical protein